MEVSFEAVSTQWKDYILILVFVTKIWCRRIMSSENATLVKSSILNNRYLPCRELVKTDKFVFTITQIIQGWKNIFDEAHTFENCHFGPLQFEALTLPCKVNLSLFYIRTHISTLNFLIIRENLELLPCCFLELIFQNLVEPFLPILTQFSKIDMVIKSKP